MDDVTLRRVQLVQLEILKAFRDVCNAHGLRYILGSGTLLGAIRHEGFIPWDDDIDVEMPRTDYELFLQYADEMGERFSVQTWKNDNEYAVPFAKVRMSGTVYQEKNSVHLKNNGIFIDIFPCDYIYGRRIEKYRFTLMNYVRLILIEKSEAYSVPSSVKGIVKKGILSVLCLLPRKLLIDLYEKLAKWNIKKGAGEKYFANEGASSAGSWIIESNCFEDIVLHRFEDDEFSIPRDYDGYLSRVYGDYMKLPPENERGNRHGIVKVVFREDMK